MKKLLEHKWHYLSLVVIFGLFLYSVQIRQEKLSLPHSIQHEWVTSHVLITCEIWDEAGGPQAYNFNPVYTYPGEGNKGLGNLGGVMDPADGKQYYISYPPFAFICAYYATKLLGGPDISSIRAFGLILHLLCALLIYLIFVKLRKSKKDSISIAGLTASVLYLFSTGFLWGHSIIYFADILVQPLIILALLFTVRLIKQDYKNELMFLIAFGVIIFIGTYTEWLGLFFSFITGITFLVFYFVQKKKVFLKSFLIVGFSASLALSITLIQYVSISGWETLNEVASMKFEERSGNQEKIYGLEIYNWENPKSLEFMEIFLNRNFLMVINMFGICFFFLIPVLIWRKSRNKISGLSPKLIIFGILFLSILLHNVLFFNFNVLHNFANLKTGLLMVMTIGLVFSIVEESINWKLNLALGGILLYLLIPRIQRDTRKFDELYSYNDFNQGMMVSAQTMREYGDPDKMILGNFFPTPGYIYEAHHNLFPIQDTSACVYFMELFNCDQAQYYQHENFLPKYMLELKNEQGRLVVVERIDF